MISALRPSLAALARFLRTPTVGRRIAGLLALAVVLLLATNLATFVMIQRTARFNDDVEQIHTLRREVRSVLIHLIDAETGQRGFLLTGNAEYLRIHAEAVAALPESLNDMTRTAGPDPDVGPRAELLRELAQEKMAELQCTIDLARTARLGQALGAVRSNSGKARMDNIRAEAAAIDDILQTRLQFRTRQSEWASGVTVLANALGGAFILILAAASAWLIRRYVIEIRAARDAVSRLAASLESQVRDRTAALTRANEEIQRFAYIVSHDLRAPLVNVMGYTAELEQAGQVLDRQIAAIETRAPKSVDPKAVVAIREDVPEAIGFIRASTAKMDRLINAILKLSREGRRHLTPEYIDVTAMVQAIADSVRHQTETARATIEVQPLPRLESDRLSLEQVFGNLIDNAVKYLDPVRPGLIVVSGVETGDGHIVYRVSDNGRGVSPSDHQRIFELFRRAGRQDRPGEGLGLAFVRNSVRRLGGEITLESELGKGSTFIVKFPTRLTVQDAGDFQ